MRYKEAIEILTHQNEDLYLEDEAIEIAIECIKMQIPRKPIRCRNVYCPTCDSEDSMDILWTDYCPNCGQRLDWSE